VFPVDMGRDRDLERFCRDLVVPPQRKPIKSSNVVVDWAVPDLADLPSSVFVGCSRGRKRSVFHASDRSLAFIWIRYGTGGKRRRRKAKTPFKPPEHGQSAGSKLR
jgi:hypothetical protein